MSNFVQKASSFVIIIAGLLSVAATPAEARQRDTSAAVVDAHHRRPVDVDVEYRRDGADARSHDTRVGKRF